MRKRLFKVLFSCIILLMLVGCGKAKEEKEKQMSSEADAMVTKDVFAMDTTMTLTAYGEHAADAVEAAEKEIKRLDALLSTGSDDSEITILNENGSEYLSKDTAYLLKRSLEIYESTNGAFDITVYPLMQAWGFTSHKYRVPEEKQIEKLLKHVGASRITFDNEKRFATIPEDVKIDLGGIAKGYTSSRIMEIFATYEVMAGIVSLGGNVQLYNAKPDGSLWRVAIENPNGDAQYLGILETRDKAVITSGGYERYFKQNGKTYHHIIDPATGYPAEHGLKSVTIVSEDGTLADGLSTSLFVMGKDRAVAYWKQNRDRFDIILEEEDGTLTISKGIADAFTSDFAYQVLE